MGEATGRQQSAAHTGHCCWEPGITPGCNLIGCVGVSLYLGVGCVVLGGKTGALCCNKVALKHGRCTTVKGSEQGACLYRAPNNSQAVHRCVVHHLLVIHSIMHDAITLFGAGMRS